MLHVETVEPHTFSVLEKLMIMPQLKAFSLVGGTALSLLYGHRTSVDLDLFSNVSFENNEIVNALQKKFKKSFDNRTSTPRFGIFCYVDKVKVDIVRHPHPLIRPELIMEGIRMFSIEDIIAMKVQAILGRGKKKDFYDIAELLNHYSVADFEKFHKEKYSTQNLLISVPQAMIYYSDADDSEDPVSLKNQTWDKVKKSISKKVRDYLK
jgi:predicted nucleotidyltransferase component of viral defense system